MCILTHVWWGWCSIHALSRPPKCHSHTPHMNTKFTHTNTHACTARTQAGDGGCGDGGDGGDSGGPGGGGGDVECGDMEVDR